MDRPTRSRRLLLGVVVTSLVLLALPTAAISAGSFEDVPEDHTFKSDIDWLASAGVTKGCNPSEGNTRFCPDDPVTRGQMAAFMHRLASLVTAAKDHEHPDDSLSVDDVRDATEIKVRYSVADNNLDLEGSSGYVRVCETTPMTFTEDTTILGNGVLDLKEWGTHTGNDPYGYISWSDDGGTSWTSVMGFSHAFPVEDEKNISIALDVVDVLPAGTYTFAVRIWALENLKAGNDYYYHCSVSIEALVGQGATTDVEIVNET